MRILHIKTTPIANAPDALSDAMKKYGNVESTVQTPWDKVEGKYDVIFFHNKYFSTKGFDKEIIMYHSEPFMVDLNIPNHVIKTVIAQYHASLPEYKNCTIVRNVIDYNDNIYDPVLVNKIKIGYSPSNKGSFGAWHNKGYEQTKNILESLKKKYGNKIDYDIITDVPLDQCLKRKAQCNIIIDEVITGSYHRSGLEGLALGKLTICNISSDVVKTIENVTNANNPFYPSTIDTLESDLSFIIDNITVDEINAIGNNNRLWMEQNWSPEIIVKEFLNILI